MDKAIQTITVMTIIQQQEAQAVNDDDIIGINKNDDNAYHIHMLSRIIAKRLNTIFSSVI
jgi:hypothetical protein